MSQETDSKFGGSQYGHAAVNLAEIISSTAEANKNPEEAARLQRLELNN